MNYWKDCLEDCENVVSSFLVTVLDMIFCSYTNSCYDDLLTTVNIDPIELTDIGFQTSKTGPK